MIMMDIYMVGIWQCHIPTPIHYDIFPPGGNMTGGNLLANHLDFIKKAKTYNMLGDISHDHDHDR